MRKTIFTPGYRQLVEDLRLARIGRRMRQEDVGKRMGCTRHWVAKVEACQARLDLVQFVRLCRVYGLNTNRILRRLGEETPEEGDPPLLAIREWARRKNGGAPAYST